MITLSNITSSGARAYYESAAGEYYHSDSKTTEWQGNIAADLGLLGQEVNLDHFEKLTHGLGLKGEALVKSAGAENHRAGIDLTFGAPKSLSLLSLIDPQLRDAHQQAVTKTLDYIEEKYTKTRTMHNGEKSIEDTGKFLVAKFEHHTNRNIEPHLHTHAVVINLTQDSSSKYKTLHNDPFYIDQKKLGQLYRMELAKNVIEKGYAINITDRAQGFFDIKGVSKEVNQAFSTRREDVVKKVAELKNEFGHIRSARLHEMAALDTRMAKTKDLTKPEFDLIVEKTLSKFNLTLDGLQQASRSLSSKPPNEKSLPLASAETYLKQAIQGIEINHSAWRKAEVLDHTAKLTMGAFSIRELSQGFKKIAKENHVTSLGQKKGQTYFSSKAMQLTELNISNIVKSGQNTSAVYLESSQPLKTNLEIIKEIKNHNHSENKNNNFTPGQNAALSLILTSQDKIIGIQGDAGTGKTFIMNEARQVFESYGITVKGLAPTGKSVEELETGAHIKNAQTVDSLLIKIQNQQILLPTQKEVWIIDEAGMIGSNKMEKILAFTQNTNNLKIVLVGDIKQFQSIEQGKIFHDLQKSGVMQFVTMRDVLRQKTEETKQVVKNFNDYFRTQDKSHIKSAFELLTASHNLSEVKQADVRIKAIAHEYMNSFHEKKTLIITNTNQDKCAINQEIRAALKSNGTILQGINFETLHSSGLSGKSKMFAESYTPGQVIFFQSKFNDIARGTEGTIVKTNSQSNTIDINYYDKFLRQFKITNIALDAPLNNEKLQVFNKATKEFSIGDKVIFGKNDNKLGIKNGQMGTIRDLLPNGNITIATSPSKNVELNLKGNGPSPYKYIDHAYALTEYKSQGATVDKLIWSADSKTANFNSGYVAVTRTKETIKIFTDNITGLEKNINRQSSKTSTLEFSNHSKLNNELFKIPSTFNNPIIHSQPIEKNHHYSR